MADSHTTAVRMTARIIDSLNVEAWANSYALVDPASTITDILGFLASWVSDVDALSDGQVLDCWIQVVPALPGGVKSSPVSGSRVGQTALLDFHATGTPRRWAEAIPALSNAQTQTVAGRTTIIQTPGSPAKNLIDLLLTTGSSIIEWTNANDQPLVTFVDSSISFRKYSRQLAVATFEEINIST